jgi:protein-S-isoprenylcysteine O-methyltransferase Ste14
MVIGLSLRYTSSRSFLLPYLGQTALRGSLVWAFTLPLFALVRRIKQEESMLEKKFGSEWRQYCQRSWKLVPFIW